MYTLPVKSLDKPSRSFSQYFFKTKTPLYIVDTHAEDMMCVCKENIVEELKI